MDSNGDPTPKAVGCGILLIVAVIGMLVMGFGGTAKVDAGELCIAKRSGQVRGERTPGFHFKMPILDKYACYETVSQTYEVVKDPKNSESNADYVDYIVDGVTKDGQQMDLTFTIRYKVDPSKVIFIHTNVAKNMGLVNERVIKFHARPIVRQIANTHTAEELYLGDLSGVSQEMFDALAPRFADSGVILEYFEIKRPSFSEAYMGAIESKQLEVEKAEAKKKQTITAQQEAERLKAEKQGQADALQIQVQGEVDAQIKRAEGNAKAMEVEGQMLQQYPEILQQQQIEALANADLIVVPDSSMPILPLQTPAPTPTPAAEK